MAVQNSLAKKPAQQVQKYDFSAYLAKDVVKKKIEQVVGGKSGQRFVASIVSAVNSNATLAECRSASILSAALLGESLNLSPSPQLGHFYIVPYNDKNLGKVGQFILGYKGYLQLAIRSGYYKKINVVAIKQGELISFNPIEEEIKVKLIEDEEKRENAETIGYYAMLECINGYRKAIYWSKAKMENHAITYSKGYKAKKGFTFWEKDFDGMAFKTMLRQLISKWGIMSVELQQAFENDDAFIDENGQAHFVDNDADLENIPTAEVVENNQEETTNKQQFDR